RSSFDDQRLTIVAHRSCIDRLERPCWREPKILRERAGAPPPYIREARSVAEVHPAEHRVSPGVLGDPPQTLPVGTERDRRESRASLTEDEPGGVGPLVRREPDRLFAALVHHERERQTAGVVRHLEI